MQENLLFEYAVIRVVPKVEREEFVNVGVILFCSGKKFLQCAFDLNTERIKSLDKSFELDELSGYISSFQKICKGGKEGGSIGQLPIAERFRWLTATRSTILQTSKVHPGLCTDPQEMLDKLFRQLVLVEEKS